MGVSKYRGTPKSSILVGFSIIFTIHLGGTPIFGNTYFGLSLVFLLTLKGSTEAPRMGCPTIGIVLGRGRGDVYKETQCCFFGGIRQGFHFKKNTWQK